MSFFLLPRLTRAYLTASRRAGEEAAGRVLLRSPRLVRLGTILGALCVPLAAYSLYERWAPLPFDSNLRFPLLAKYYIRRALWAGSLDQKAFYLDQAMRRVLAAGLGAASPQSTALVIYLSQLYLEQQPHPDPASLRASHAALVHKPHIGEGAAEERARLEMSFKVADRLCDLLREAGDPSGAAEYAEKALSILERAPPYLRRHWVNHPLRPKFRSVLLGTSDGPR